jgi:2-keto-4-pentenoate hydratase
MPLGPDTLRSLAQSLLGAARTPHSHERPSDSLGLSVDDAYATQAHQVELLQQQGESVVAIKLGLTDQAQRDAAAWEAPSFGTLTDSMILHEGEPFSVTTSLLPRVEPEIVVILDRTITEPVSLEAISTVIRSVHVGIEIVDPRYVDPAFILTDALADNSSARSGVWAEAGVSPADIDLRSVSATLSVDGVDVLSGRADALMGNPLLLVKEVIDERLRLGVPVEAGLAIFTGNIAGKAHPVSAGQHVKVTAVGLGVLELGVVA